MCVAREITVSHPCSNRAINPHVTRLVILSQVHLPADADRIHEQRLSEPALHPARLLQVRRDDAARAHVAAEHPDLQVSWTECFLLGFTISRLWSSPETMGGFDLSTNWSLLSCTEKCFLSSLHVVWGLRDSRFSFAKFQEMGPW